MKSIFYILFFLSSPWFALSQTSNDTCKWEIPTTITMDCEFGKDYQFSVTCACETKDFSLSIFNRWGKIVFESKDINDFWDASQRESDTFFWIIAGTYKDGEKFKKQGTVVLIR